MAWNAGAQAQVTARLRFNYYYARKSPFAWQQPVACGHTFSRILTKRMIHVTYMQPHTY
jgi:hypothetical protein